MSASVFRKIGKILEKPVEPAYIRERRHRVTIPWYEDILKAILPPMATPSGRPAMAVSQRRVLFFAGAIIVAAIAGWGLYSYLSTAPERAETAYRTGLKLLGPADFKGAAAKFSESISIRETVPALIQRGNVYQKLGQSDKALADWGRAIDLDSSSVEAYAARGTYYRIAGKNAQAISDLDRSIQMKSNVEALYQRGQVFEALGKFDEALKDYNQAIELHREVPYLYHARASARRALGDPQGSLDDQTIAERLEDGQHR